MSECPQRQLSGFTHRSSFLAATSRLRRHSLPVSVPPRPHVFDSGAFVDLTSSPCSSPRSAACRGPAVVSTVELADPSLDLADVRASLSALQQAVDQTETLRELRWNHEVLRREFLASRRRAKDLDRQLAGAANTASPYVLFCQHKYGVVRHKLESTRTELADCLNALQKRLDYSRELEACRLRYHDLKLRYNAAVSEFNDCISTLEAQLAAASSFGVIVPPDTARRIADLESQLARSQIDLQELRESATSHKAAQAEIARLEAAIKRKNGRLRTLNDNYERRLRVADTTIATQTAELGRLQDRVSTLDRDLQKASQRAQAAISQRDQARAAHIATQDRVSAARDTIARLEKRINQVERSQKSRQDLKSALATLQQEKDALAVQSDELLGQLGERFMERARSESESPTQSTRVSKAARSTSSLPQTGASSHAPAPGSSIELLSAVAAGQKAKRSVLSPPFAGPPDHLPRSVRSTAKSSSGGASSSPAASEAGARSNGGESSSGESGSTHVFDSDAAGSDSDSPESSCAKNEFGMSSGPLSDAKLAALPPTTVPPSECIPGYRDRRSFRGHDIVPWSAQDIRQTSIVEMDADLLFHHYTKPKEWLIPLRDPVPPLGDWRDDLVDESNVRSLVESAPWEILAAPLDPLTFKSRGWFRHMKRFYTSYEAEHLRAYWDSTHAFPVSISKRRASRYLDAFYTDRKQRRSRAGARWKSFLQQVLIGLLRGYCDLDLLLDPFFLHFPRPGEAGAWYPGIEYDADPADLLEALTITDAADRWRNHYRDVPEEHPALEIARLRGKFLSSSS
ncbi:hypothetical protein F442_23080 [Phytophthora nicotianae P10297]|uniref:Autophagy-related protein 16 domain-containing protein n=1 Tax=Phytophthora nicotianae P10297 TaxID=1317064 RepID=W2Y0D3_PHYNI|nr:hypothetical protein F442_23080 [Phytophthora nicotianae P10297]